MRKTILIIDDDKTQRKLYTIALESRYDIIEATSAEEGLIVMTDQKPDLVILDHILPGESGKALLADLYTKAIKHPPILFLSAEMDEDLRRRAMALGAFDAFPKAKASDLLLPAIQKALTTNAVAV